MTAQNQFSAKISAFALAVLTSATVLGAVVGGMQAQAQAPAQVVALETVTITASRAN
jgi:hypothetical protein